MTRENRFKSSFSAPLRSIAFVVVLSFLVQDASWSQGGVWPTRAESAKKEAALPAQLGLLRQTQEGSVPGKIFQIQDAHDSLSSQEKIAGILETLVQDYDLRLVALEGSVGEIDASILRTFPEKEVRDAFAHDLLEQGELNAGEFFSVISKSNVKVMGVDDPALYVRDVRHFKQLIENKRRFAGAARELERVVSEIERKSYPEEIFKLLPDSNDGGETPVTERWAAIAKAAAKAGISTEGYSSLKRLEELKKLEGRIDFKKADSEREAFVRNLNSRLSAEDLRALAAENLRFQSGAVTEGQYHLHLSELARREGISPDAYENLALYIRYQLDFEEINLAALLDEAERFEGRVFSKILSPELKRVRELAHRAGLAGRLFNGLLSSKQFAEYSETPEQFTFDAFRAELERAAATHGIRIDSEKIKPLFDSLPAAAEFYRIAQERDGAIVRNMIARMKEDGAAACAVVTGGFHTEGISELLKGEKLSYLVVMPKIAANDKKRPYIAILTKRGGDEFGALKKDYDIQFGTVWDSAASGSFYASETKKREVKLYVMKLLAAYAFSGRAATGEDIRRVKAEWLAAFRNNGRKLAITESEFMNVLDQIPDSIFESAAARRSNVVSIDSGNGHIYRFAKQGERIETRVLRAPPAAAPAGSRTTDGSKFLQILRNVQSGWFTDREAVKKNIIELANRIPEFNYAFIPIDGPEESARYLSAFKISRFGGYSLAVLNRTANPASGNVRLNVQDIGIVPDEDHYYLFRDRLGKTYLRNGAQIQRKGLEIFLEGHGIHVFDIEPMDSPPDIKAIRWAYHNLEGRGEDFSYFNLDNLRKLYDKARAKNRFRVYVDPTSDTPIRTRDFTDEETMPIETGRYFDLSGNAGLRALAGLLTVLPEDPDFSKLPTGRTGETTQKFLKHLKDTRKRYNEFFRNAKVEVLESTNSEKFLHLLLTRKHDDGRTEVMLYQLNYSSKGQAMDSTVLKFRDGLAWNPEPRRGYVITNLAPPPEDKRFAPKYTKWEAEAGWYMNLYPYVTPHQSMDLFLVTEAPQVELPAYIHRARTQDVANLRIFPDSTVVDAPGVSPIEVNQPFPIARLTAEVFDPVNGQFKPHPIELWKDEDAGMVLLSGYVPIGGVGIHDLRFKLNLADFGGDQLTSGQDTSLQVVHFYTFRSGIPRIDPEKPIVVEGTIYLNDAHGNPARMKPEDVGEFIIAEAQSNQTGIWTSVPATLMPGQAEGDRFTFRAVVPVTTPGLSRLLMRFAVVGAEHDWVYVGSGSDVKYWVQAPMSERMRMFNQNERRQIASGIANAIFGPAKGSRATLSALEKKIQSKLLLASEHMLADVTDQGGVLAASDYTYSLDRSDALGNGQYNYVWLRDATLFATAMNRLFVQMKAKDLPDAEISNIVNEYFAYIHRAIRTTKNMQAQRFNLDGDLEPDTNWGDQTDGPLHIAKFTIDILRSGVLRQTRDRRWAAELLEEAVGLIRSNIRNSYLLQVTNSYEKSPLGYDWFEEHYGKHAANDILQYSILKELEEALTTEDAAKKLVITESEYKDRLLRAIRDPFVPEDTETQHPDLRKTPAEVLRVTMALMYEKYKHLTDRYIVAQRYVSNLDRIDREKIDRLDSSVIGAINLAPYSPYRVDDGFTLATYNALDRVFNGNHYPILAQIRKKFPLAALWGRYGGDRFDGRGDLGGGNPWHIAILWSVQFNLQFIDKMLNDGFIDFSRGESGPDRFRELRRFFRGQGVDINNLHIKPGDRIMESDERFSLLLDGLWQRVNQTLAAQLELTPEDMSFSEQIDKYTGKPRGAYPLNWSNWTFVVTADQWKKTRDRFKARSTAMPKVAPAAELASGDWDAGIGTFAVESVDPALKTSFFAQSFKFLNDFNGDNGVEQELEDWWQVIQDNAAPIVKYRARVMPNGAYASAYFDGLTFYIPSEFTDDNLTAPEIDAGLVLPNRMKLDSPLIKELMFRAFLEWKVRNGRMAADVVSHLAFQMFPANYFLQDGQMVSRLDAKIAVLKTKRHWEAMNPQMPRASIYEFNTALHLKRLGQASGKAFASLADISIEWMWKLVSLFGIHVLWSMGIWERSKIGAQITREAKGGSDKFGASPYAPRAYRPAAEFGGEEGWWTYQDNVRKAGMIPGGDWVTNHTGFDHEWILNPETADLLYVWLKDGRPQGEPGDWYLYKQNDNPELNVPAQYGRSVLKATENGRPLGTGDVAQLFPRNAKAWDVIIAEMEKAASYLCGRDGQEAGLLRVDLADYFMRHHVRGRLQKYLTPAELAEFDQTYGGLEFWEVAIPRLKKRFPLLTLVAEMYGGPEREAELLAMGFDLVYDKQGGVYEMLVDRKNTNWIGGHLRKLAIYAKWGYYFVGFLDNHDEPSVKSILSRFWHVVARFALKLTGMATLMFEDEERGDGATKHDAERISYEPHEINADPWREGIYNDPFFQIEAFKSGRRTVLLPKKKSENDYNIDAIAAYFIETSGQSYVTYVNNSGANASAYFDLPADRFPPAEDDAYLYVLRDVATRVRHADARGDFAEPEENDDTMLRRPSDMREFHIFSSSSVADAIRLMHIIRVPKTDALVSKLESLSGAPAPYREIAPLIAGSRLSPSDFDITIPAKKREVAQLLENEIPKDFVDHFLMAFTPEHLAAETVPAERLVQETRLAYEMYNGYLSGEPDRVKVASFNPKESKDLTEVFFFTRDYGLIDEAKEIVKAQGKNVQQIHISIQSHPVTALPFYIVMFEITDSVNGQLGEEARAALEAAILKKKDARIEAHENEMVLRGNCNLPLRLASGEIAMYAEFGAGLKEVIYNIIPVELRGVSKDSRQILRIAEIIERDKQDFNQAVSKTLEKSGLPYDAVEFIEETRVETLRVASQPLGRNVHYRRSAVSIFLDLVNQRLAGAQKTGLGGIDPAGIKVIEERILADLAKIYVDYEKADRNLKVFDEAANAILKKAENFQHKDYGGIKMVLNSDIFPAVRQLIKESRLAPEVAIDRVTEVHLEPLKKMSGKWVEFANELEGVMKQIVLLIREEGEGIRQKVIASGGTQKPIVLFARNLDPFQLVDLLKEYQLAAIVSDQGSLTSHWVVVAASHNVPVFLIDSQYRSLDLADRSLVGRTVIVDGNGILTVNPSRRKLKDYKARKDRYEALNRVSMRHVNEPAVTPANQTLRVMANADDFDSMGDAVKLYGAEGMGLVRTEFEFKADNKLLSEYLEIYESHRRLPSEDTRKKLAAAREKLVGGFSTTFKAYAAAGRGKPVKLRMYDFERDKPMSLPNEEGVYGPAYYRTPLGRELLMIELEAALRAQAEHGNIQIMFPSFRATQDLAAFLGKSHLEGLTKNNRIKLIQLTLSDVDFDLEMLAEAKERTGKFLESTVAESKRALPTTLLASVKHGFMIETLETADGRVLDYILDKSHFISIGTNDLTVSSHRDNRRITSPILLGLARVLDRVFKVIRAWVHVRFMPFGLRRQLDEMYAGTKNVAFKSVLKVFTSVTGISRDRSGDSDYFEKIQPRVLALVRRTLAAVDRKNQAMDLMGQPRKSAGICGDMARYYAFALAMTHQPPSHLEVELSVPPLIVPGLKHFLRHAEGASDDIAALERQSKVILKKLEKTDEFKQELEQVKREAEAPAKGSRVAAQIWHAFLTDEFRWAVLSLMSIGVAGIIVSLLFRRPKWRYNWEELGKILPRKDVRALEEFVEELPSTPEMQGKLVEWIKTAYWQFGSYKPAAPQDAPLQAVQRLGRTTAGVTRRIQRLFLETEDRDAFIRAMIEALLLDADKRIAYLDNTLDLLMKAEDAAKETHILDIPDVPGQVIHVMLEMDKPNTNVTSRKLQYFARKTAQKLLKSGFEVRRLDVALGMLDHELYFSMTAEDQLGNIQEILHSAPIRYIKGATGLDDKIKLVLLRLISRSFFRIEFPTVRNHGADGMSDADILHILEQAYLSKRRFDASTGFRSRAELRHELPDRFEIKYYGPDDQRASALYDVRTATFSNAIFFMGSRTSAGARIIVPKRSYFFKFQFWEKEMKALDIEVASMYSAGVPQLPPADEQFFRSQIQAAAGYYHANLVSENLVPVKFLELIGSVDHVRGWVAKRSESAEGGMEKELYALLSQKFMEMERDLTQIQFYVAPQRTSQTQTAADLEPYIDDGQTFAALQDIVMGERPYDPMVRAGALIKMGSMELAGDSANWVDLLAQRIELDGKTPRAAAAVMLASKLSANSIRSANLLAALKHSSQRTRSDDDLAGWLANKLYSKIIASRKKTQGARSPARIVIAVSDRGSLAGAKALVAEHGLKGVAVVPIRNADVESMTRQLNARVRSRGALGGILFDADLSTNSRKLRLIQLISEQDSKSLALNPLFGMLTQDGASAADLQAIVLASLAYLPSPTPKTSRIGLFAAESYPVRYAQSLETAVSGYIKEGQGSQAIGRLTRETQNRWGEAYAQGGTQALTRQVEEAVSAQEDAAERLRLSIFHPAFTYQMHDEVFQKDIETGATNKAAVHSLEEILNDPFFFETVQDAEASLADGNGGKRLHVERFVVIEGRKLSKEELIQKLGDRYEQFADLFRDDRIIWTGGNHSRSAVADQVWQALGWAPNAGNLLFIDRRPDAGEGDWMTLVLEGEYPLNLQKVALEILASEGDIAPGLIRGLKRLRGRVFLFHPAVPLDYQRLFERYHVQETVQEAA